MVTRREIRFGCRGITVTSDISILMFSVVKFGSLFGAVGTLWKRKKGYNPRSEDGTNQWIVELAFLVIKSLLNAEKSTTKGSGEMTGG